jgi:chromosome segregation ATPase
LRLVKVRDLLGFQGEHSFDFGPRLQVFEAPNHSGKSSLAMAVLWGLTGAIPALDRLNRQSYRLSNKHAGENAKTSVEIVLEDATGSRMEIRRPYVGRTRGGEDPVDLTVGDEELSGAEATARILLELGVGQSSLEGCGVVLQDHRLKLITGKDAEISEVINDMLGLAVLSEVVPMLESMSTNADQLRKEMEAFMEEGDPLVRWEEGRQRIEKDLHTRENRALKAAFDPVALEAPRRLAEGEVSSLAAALKTDPPKPDVVPRDEIERFRKRLANLRKGTPLFGELTTVGAQRPPVEAAVKSVRKLAKKWRDHDGELAQQAGRGELDLETLSGVVADCDRRLAQNKALAEEGRGTQRLLDVAYAHLLQHPETESCPLCQSRITGKELGESVRARIDSKLVTELECLAGEEREMKAKKQRVEKRMTEVQELKKGHNQLVQEAETELERLTEIGYKTTWSVDAKQLFESADARTALALAIEKTVVELEGRVADLLAQEEKLQGRIEEQEAQVFQPLESRMNRVRDDLIPLLDTVEELQIHGSLRDEASRRTDELQKILREAKDTASRLKRIAAAVSEVESARATESIRTRLPFVSDFFAKVAGNPDFTGLEIETSMVRNKVTYSLRATSSKMAALGDAVGHVLSEGDMSAAGMALALGLASGDSHCLGFLLLDDPAQGMDPTLQRNFARELARLPEIPQMIILTHQPDFAEALVAEGAHRRTLGRWEGGRLSSV